MTIITNKIWIKLPNGKLELILGIFPNSQSIKIIIRIVYNIFSSLSKQAFNKKAKTKQSVLSPISLPHPMLYLFLS